MDNKYRTSADRVNKKALEICNGIGNLFTGKNAQYFASPIMILSENHLMNQIEIKQVRAACCIGRDQKKEELRDEAAYIMLLLAKMELEHEDDLE